MYIIYVCLYIICDGDGEAPTHSCMRFLIVVGILSEIVNDTLDISKFSTKPRLVEIDII